VTDSPIDTNLLNPDLFPSAEGPPHAAFDAWRVSDPMHWNPVDDAYRPPMRGLSNRDPSVFANPHALDITRKAGKHLAFGTGPHVCLGARLARLELHALLKQIVTRIPEFRISGEVQRLRSIWFDAIANLPVQFTPGRATAAR
jgi:hypothetical protein